MKKCLSVVTMLAVLAALSMQAVLADESAEMFARLDVNADGFISPQEAEALEDLPDSFEDGDSNDDGLLDPEEFKKLDVTDE